MTLKPMPIPDAESKPFWEACRARELRIERCAECGTPRFPPASLCPRCRSARHEWIKASGRGSVFSWIVVRHPVPRDLYASEVPYVVALVELEEGVRMPTNIVGCEPEAIRAGMAVEVVFEDIGGDVTLPKFRPLEAR